MGREPRYQELSPSEESFEQSPEKLKQTHFGWGKQSFLVAVATGTLFIAVLLAIVVTLGSAIVSYRLTTPSSTPSSTPTSTPSVTATAAPIQSAVADDKTASSTDDSAALLQISSCGGSAEEARALGCIFDVMMQLWMPVECYDQALSERFLAEGNWTWWADSSASRAMSDEEIRRGEHDAVYVAQDYHVTHCIYAWEMLVRTMRNQQPMIQELISYDHVIHCRHNTLQRPDDGGYVRGVRAPTGFTRCASYEVWKNDLPPNQISSTD